MSGQKHDYADTMRYYEAEQKGEQRGIGIGRQEGIGIGTEQTLANVFKAKDMLTRGESPDTISEIPA